MSEQSASPVTERRARQERRWSAAIATVAFVSGLGGLLGGLAAIVFAATELRPDRIRTDIGGDSLGGIVAALAILVVVRGLAEIAFAYGVASARTWAAGLGVVLASLGLTAILAVPLGFQGPLLILALIATTYWATTLIFLRRWVTRTIPGRAPLRLR